MALSGFAQCDDDLGLTSDGCKCDTPALTCAEFND